MDYSTLLDQELFSLIQEIKIEISKRSSGTEAEATFLLFGFGPEEMNKKKKEATLEALGAVRKQQEKQMKKKALRVAEEERNTKQQIVRWTKKKDIASQIKEILGSGWSLNVWNKSDKRVYLDGPKYQKICYYAVGSSQNPPGKLSSDNIELKPNQEERLIQIFREATRLWSTTRFDIDQTASWVAPPL